MNTDFTNLDFFEIKQQIINYYSSKTEFQDVNFLGSTANLLMDSIAWAIHTMAVHANFAISETFLDSVLQRGNALSRAKELGYGPATVTSAVMRVKVTVDGNVALDPDIILSRGELFDASSTVGFVNLDGVTLTKELDELGEFVDETQRVGIFDIYQGTLLSKTEVVGVLDDFQRFYLYEKNIDANRIRVSVDGVDWTRYDGTIAIESDTQIWYVQENTQGQIEVYFGNDIVGAKPTPGQSVKIEYLVTDGLNGNDIEVISYPAQSANSDWSITVEEMSQGGAEQQSTHRIANTAPLLHQAQKRAVIEADYLGLLKSTFSWIEAVNVWGGEDNDPPQYGKVFVAIKPFGADYIAPSLQDQVKSEVIEKYNVLGIIPEIVEADYTHVDVASEVFWNEARTEDDAATIKNDDVEPAIVEYFTNEVSDFTHGLYFSKLVASIDDSHTAISHNDSVLTMYKKYKPIPFTLASHNFQYFNAIKAGSIRSAIYNNISGDDIQFRDNGNGLLDEYLNDNLNTSGVGSVDYNNGTITLTQYTFEAGEDVEIWMYASPAGQDVNSGVNNLILLGTSTVSMTKV